jgi:formate dehydrogenase major subunit
VLHQIGLPYHWGANGLVTGDSANDLLPLALDPNVFIQEVKARPATSGPAAARAAPRCAELVMRVRASAAGITEHTGEEGPR